MFAKQVYKKIIDNVDLSIEDFGLTRWAYGDAWNSGYGLGKSLVDKLDAFELGKVPDMGSLTANDNSLEDTLGDVADGVDSIANNTEEIKNNSDIVDLIRDYHSRLATQKSTTQYVTIDMSGQTNHINKSMELSDLMDSIVNSARQAAAVMTEGV
jgi:methyl-accepting chemotaxis protein